MDFIVPENGILIWQLSTLFYLGFWVFPLIDMIRSEFKDGQTKLIWVIVIVFVPILGTFIYWIMNRKTKKAFEDLIPI